MRSTATGTLVALALVACGGGTDPSSGGTAEPAGEATAQPEIEYVQADPPADDCDPLAEFETLQEGVLRIAAVNAMPKLDAEPGNEGVRGISGETLTLFAEAHCLTPDWMVLSGPAAVETMAQGRADVAGGDWTKSPERGEIMAQSDPAWYDSSVIASHDGYSSIEELEGLQIGANAASTYFAPLQEQFGEDNVRGYDLTESVFQDLAAGRLDATVSGGAETAWIAEQQGASDLEIVSLSPSDEYPELTRAIELNWPHIEGNSELTDAINGFIAQLHEDGTMEEILATYGLTDPVHLQGHE